MLPIPPFVVQQLVQRSLIGARATDPVLPERRVRPAAARNGRLTRPEARTLTR